MVKSIIQITTKNNDPEELKVKKFLEEILEKYSCPVFTKKMIIEKGAIPHSAPVLTLNCRHNSPLSSLAVLVHEQFHWFFDNNQNKEEYLNFARQKYLNLNDCYNKNNPNSFWEHLAVCWNTRNWLRENYTPDQCMFVYEDWKDIYPITEKFVEDNFEQLRYDLEKFDMVYKGK